MSLEILVTFTIATLVLTFIPGPAVSYTIAHVFKFGTGRTLLTIVGQLMAESVQLSLVFFGLHTLLERSTEMFFLLKIVGAIYLVYLGVQQWRAGKPELGASNQVLQSKSTFKALVNGFIACITNPKVILYYAAFFPQFILPHSNETFQFIILGSISLITSFFVLSTYTILGEQIRRWLINNNYWNIQNRIAGLFMMVAGAALALVNKE